MAVIVEGLTRPNEEGVKAPRVCTVYGKHGDKGGRSLGSEGVSA